MKRPDETGPEPGGTPIDSVERPGISTEFLSAVGCHHVGIDQCVKLYGFRTEGIAIPFRDVNGSSITDNGKPFARVRLYFETDNQKYHQRPGSGVHIYVPPGFADRPKSSTLILVEGEFKAIALAEAGYAALGLCGLNGACRSISSGEERTHALQDELITLLELHRPARIVLLGDSDVVFNSQFAAEAAKLRKLSRGSKRFSFIENVLAVKPPVCGPKGIDDCREKRGDAFNDWFEKLLANAFDIPAKTTASELFVEFLQREMKPVKKLLAVSGHEARRARNKLLHSASQLWNETGAKLELKPLLGRVLGVAESSVTGLVRDAATTKPVEQAVNVSPQCEGGANLNGVESPAIEPWPYALNGAVLLDALAAEFERFLWLPQHGATILACYTLYTYVWRSFEYAPILAVTSPTPGCGKGRVLDVLQKLVSNPWRTGNPTEAVLFRIIHAKHPVCLIDEFDSLLPETRAAITNILNQAFHVSGRVHRVEGDRERKVVEFQCFCPNVVACIKTNSFGRATVTRCINLRMQKKSRKWKVQRLRKYDGTEWQRKFAKWVLDNQSQIEATNVKFPDELDDRAMDIWEPLFVIAHLAGDDWPKRIRKAALALSCDNSHDEVEDSGVSVLRWLKVYFDTTGRDRVGSKVVCKWLNERPDAGFKDWREARGIDERTLSKLLRAFDIQPQNIAVGDERPKGYKREWLVELWEAHLPEDASPVDRYSATVSDNTGDSDGSASATQDSGSASGNDVSANEVRQSSEVADDQTNAAELLL